MNRSHRKDREFVCTYLFPYVLRKSRPTHSIEGNIFAQRGTDVIHWDGQSVRTHNQSRKGFRRVKMADLTSSAPREALVKSLQNLTGRQDVELLDGYEVKRATSGVEGFTSLVLRIKLQYRLPGDDAVKSHVLIVKTLSPIEFQRKIMDEAHVFSREWLVLGRMVPIMSKVSAGRVKIPAPECYYGIESGDRAGLYMEDLIHSGFRAVKRSYLLDGLDYAHCSLVMKGLGRFHGLSLAAEKTLEKGSWFAAFPHYDSEYVFYIPGPGEPPPLMENMVVSMIQNFKELCKEVEGLPKEAEASGVLDEIMEGAWPTLCRLKQTPTNNRRVVTHGDCWMNNMMFRYEEKGDAEEEPVDVKFYDLQISKLANPSIDLLYFLYLSTRRPFRERYFNSLIEEYHASLTETLKLVDGSSPPFSLSELKSDLEGEYKPFGLIMGLFFSPMMMLGDDFLLPNADDMTPEKMEEFFNTGSTGKVKMRFFVDPVYRSHVEDMIREFVDVALPNGIKSIDSSPFLAYKVK
ncbi:uncharacterized protein LOC124168161 [Ischnura elegans]|uniref:uncharacterized protein LOC124168161 n=1 Tax=Ischnura elegans TaxID=197161 RepID=UPI001ED86C9B|nr:uncharacterized protein LOC124168161 [Ischnura elegans]